MVDQKEITKTDNNSIENEREKLSLEKEKLEIMRLNLSTEKSALALRDLQDSSKIPKSFHGKMYMSEEFAKSNLIPEAYRNNPANALICLQFGEMMGFSNPMSCFQAVYVVEGRPSASSDSMIGCCMVQPEFLDYDQEIIDLGNDLTYSKNTAFRDQPAKWEKFTVRNLKSVTRITRKMPNGKDRVFTREHTTEMSLSRFAKYPQWQNDQMTMLKHRSDGKAARSAFPAVFAGIHSPEETRDQIDLVEVQDGKGNITGKMKKEEINSESVIQNDIFSSVKIKE